MNRLERKLNKALFEGEGQATREPGQVAFGPTKGSTTGHPKKKKKRTRPDAIKREIDTR